MYHTFTPLTVIYFRYYNDKIALAPSMVLMSLLECPNFSINDRGEGRTTPVKISMADVDFNLKFTYVLVGWEGSAHDASIPLTTCQGLMGSNIHERKFYLEDAGYAYCPGILPPFRKTRYHLNEFSIRNYHKTAKELFKFRHSSLRVTVERAFVALENRFKILDPNSFHVYATQIKLVLVLRNWILAGVLMNSCLMRGTSRLMALMWTMVSNK
jgi:hypothetical protein